MSIYCAASWVHWSGGPVVECGNKALGGSNFCRLHTRSKPQTVTVTSRSRKTIDGDNMKIWRSHGLTDEGARLAETIMGRMMDLAAEVGPLVLVEVADEAAFQVGTVPKMTDDGRRRHSWKKAERKKRNG